MSARQTPRQPVKVADDWVWDGVRSLDYPHAAAVLGIPVGTLKKLAPAEEVQSSRIGKHVMFTPDDIADIRRASRRPAKDAPTTLTVVPDDKYRSDVRAALVADNRRSAA